MVAADVRRTTHVAVLGATDDLMVLDGRLMRRPAIAVRQWTPMPYTDEDLERPPRLWPRLVGAFVIFAIIASIVGSIIGSILSLLFTVAIIVIAAFLLWRLIAGSGRRAH